MAYSTGWDDASSIDEPPRRGVLGLVYSAVWAAAGVGVMVAVVMWTYALGARDARDIAALTQGSTVADYLSQPVDPGGAITPGADSSAYAPLGDAAAEPNGAISVFDPTERPLGEDFDATRDQIAWAAGDPMSDAAFLQIVDEAVSEEETAGPRMLELEPVAPREGALADIGPAREDLPPNVGDGSEALPPATVAFVTGPSDAPPEAAEAAIGLLEETAPSADLNASGAAPETAPAPEPRVTAEVSTTDPLVDGAAVSTAAPVGPEIYQVQLAALDSVESVERRWAEVQIAHPDLVGNLRLDVQPFNIDNLRLYRLRIGNFSSRDEASDLCRALSARGVDCFPATK